ncbi:MAG TPA: carbohydrate kinase family protein [Armatimonadota bacterium]|nr:carbohydrate kinase family protein [Armatimonadota bacterium]
MPNIVVLGNFVVDIIGKPIDGLPERGRLALIDTLETHPGGNGPNTAGALGKLAARDGGDMGVAVAGRVGEDLYGRFLTEALEGWGVDTRAVFRDPERATALTLVAVDSTGERSFIHHLGANAAFGPEDVRWELFGGARHLHLASYFILPSLEGEAAAGVLAEARGRGMTTSLDVCWDREGRWLESLSPCLPHLDYLMPSEDEARAMTGREEPAEMADVFHAAGARAVVIKLGERGCYYADAEQRFALPAYAVEVRETTGAGDCFCAGFLHAMTRGWDLHRALRLGNACGARSVGAVGAVTGMGAAEEIEEWAKTQPLRG